MAYFAIYDKETGRLNTIGEMAIKDSPYEISAEEYERLKAWIGKKAAYVEAVYGGETAIEEVPEEFRAEVADEVALRREMDAQPEPKSDVDEALDILKGVE